MILGRREDRYVPEEKVLTVVRKDGVVKKK